MVLLVRGPVSSHKAAVVTVSNSASAGTADDTSGQFAAERLASLGFDVVDRFVIPDGIESVADTLRSLVDSVDLIVTTGGTGLSPTDLTPVWSAATTTCSSVEISPASSGCSPSCTR